VQTSRCYLSQGFGSFGRTACVVCCLLWVLIPASHAFTQSHPERLLRWRIRTQPEESGWRDHRIGWNAGSVAVTSVWTCSYSETHVEELSSGFFFRRRMSCEADGKLVGFSVDCRVERHEDGSFIRVSSQRSVFLGDRRGPETRVTFACGPMMSDFR